MLDKTDGQIAEILNSVKNSMPEITEGLLAYVSIDAKTTLMWALIWLIGCGMVAISFLLLAIIANKDSDETAEAFSAVFAVAFIGMMIALCQYVNPITRATIDNPKIGIAKMFVDKLHSNK